jgi:hypothetical protein
VVFVLNPVNGSGIDGWWSHFITFCKIGGNNMLMMLQNFQFPSQ